MKTKLFTWLFSAIALVGFASCGDDDNDLPINEVPVAYQNALRAMYPEAVNVEWERNANFYVADFEKPGMDFDVWFGAEATWAMTEIDYGNNLMLLPPAVSSAYSESQYAYTCVVDDVKSYEHTDKAFYIIEVEPTNGGDDIYVYYNPDGTTLKVITQDVDITPVTPI
ncbi:MAG: hypothetical protein HDS75_07145 [Bacteroidales bacterium]|nr:hypothetical protein [Bacteroidales bacterium]